MHAQAIAMEPTTGRAAARRHCLVPGICIRPAERRDSPAIARLFEISSGGVAGYIWQKMAADHPGLSPVEIGGLRYARENTDFSWQNCIVVERERQVVAMAHSYAMGEAASAAELAAADPVLRPYMELEAPGSLYLSGLSVAPALRGQGIGNFLMGLVRLRAHVLGSGTLSLICFADNDGAMRLYRRLGFREAARRTVVPHPLVRYQGEAVLMVREVE